MTRHLLARWRRDDGSMPVAMLLVVVSVGMSLVLSGLVSQQEDTTRTAMQRVDALNAAQGGLELALDAIRTATRADGSGNPAALPCTATTPMTGVVSAAGGAAYRVLLHYTLTQPASGDTAPANPWACGSTATGSPVYVVLQSIGTAGKATRTLVATYAFTTVTQNQKIAGGLIRAFSENGGNYCLSGGTAPDLTGTQLLVKTCDPANPRQQFAYEAGLSLALATVTSAGGARLCLDGGTTPAVNNPVTFRACAATPAVGQTWGYDDASAFYVLTGATSTTRLCLTSSAGDTDGATVRLTAVAGPTSCTSNDAWMPTGTFITDPTVGAGRAGPATGQLVNSAQFGRCVDVTANDVTSSYLVVFPCKQPLTGPVLWNQKWVLPSVPAGSTQSTGPIYTTTGGNAYCLSNPANTTRPSYYVTVRQCTPAGAVAADQMWIVRTDTGIRSTSYRIESAYGVPAGGTNLCLAPTDPAAPSPDLWTGAVAPAVYNLTASKLTVAPCDGGDLQKWNAIPVFHEAALTDVVEE